MTTRFIVIEIQIIYNHRDGIFPCNFHRPQNKANKISIIKQIYYSISIQADNSIIPQISIKQKQTMGQNSTLPLPNSPAKQLKLIDRTHGIYLNVTNSRMYSKSQLHLRNAQEAHYELDVFNFRRLNDHHLVSVDYCSTHLDRALGSCLSDITYFIEKQQYSLLDKHEMSKQEATRLLVTTLQGFLALYDRFGYFTPSPKLIFFNRFHQSKVWLSQNLEVTRNLQNTNCTKNALLENNIVRQIVKMFDALRDYSDPMFLYSRCLPQEMLTFTQTIDLFIRKLIQFDTQLRRVRAGPFGQIQNIPRVASPNFERPTNIKPNTTDRGVAHLVSPRYTPRKNMVSHCPRPQEQLLSSIKIQYCSPPKVDFISGKGAEIRNSVNQILKGSDCNSGLGHKLSPSRDFFTSTMPNSLKNSRSEDKKIYIQPLTPAISNRNSANPVDLPLKSKVKKVQISSEVQQMPSSYLESRQTFSKPSLQKNCLRRQSTIDIRCCQIDQTSYKQQKEDPHGIDLPFESPNRVPKGVKKEYRTHKRHRTDYKIKPCKDGDSGMRFNRQSMVRGTTVAGNFHCDTINSIHLMSEDHDQDESIITDLKQIINKYKIQKSK